MSPPQGGFCLCRRWHFPPPICARPDAAGGMVARDTQGRPLGSNAPAESATQHGGAMNAADPNLSVPPNNLTAREAVLRLRGSKIREVANASLGRSDVLAFWF